MNEETASQKVARLRLELAAAEAEEARNTTVASAEALLRWLKGGSAPTNEQFELLKKVIPSAQRVATQVTRSNAPRTYMTTAQKMARLEGYDGELTVKQTAELLGVSVASASTFLREMARAGEFKIVREERASRGGLPPRKYYARV